MLAGCGGVSPSVEDLRSLGVVNLHPAGTIRYFYAESQGNSGVEPTAANIAAKFATHQGIGSLISFYDRQLRRRGWTRNDNAAAGQSDWTHVWAWTKHKVQFRLGTLDQRTLMLVHRDIPKTEGTTLAYEVSVGP